NRVAHFFAELDAHRVHPIRSVEGDHSNAIIDVVQDRLEVAHVRAPLSWLSICGSMRTSTAVTESCPVPTSNGLISIAPTLPLLAAPSRDSKAIAPAMASTSYALLSLLPRKR